MIDAPAMGMRVCEILLYTAGSRGKEHGTSGWCSGISKKKRRGDKRTRRLTEWKMKRKL